MTHYYLTLTDSGTRYSLKTLAKAANASFRDVATKWRIQSAKGNTGDIYLGDDTVTSTDYGAVLLAAGDWIEIGGSLDGLYAVGDAASQIVAILPIYP